MLEPTPIALMDIKGSTMLIHRKIIAEKATVAISDLLVMLLDLSFLPHLGQKNASLVSL